MRATNGGKRAAGTGGWLMADGQVVRDVGRPAAWRYMLRALQRHDGWGRGQRFPDRRLRWDGFGVSDMGGPAAVVSPHLYGFRLAMETLTQPDWPFPVWRTLQVRNRLILHRPASPALRGVLESSVCAWRVLDKGVEVDLHTGFTDEAGCAWESVVTYYTRGAFGPCEAWGVERGAARTAPRPDTGIAPTATWQTERTKRWRYASWTGDYNGLHQWDWYARRLGFDGACAHPQRIVAQCLPRIANAVRGPQQLDLWLKGPVRYGAEVSLRERARPDGAGVDFSLTAAASSRPALLGSWRALPASSQCQRSKNLPGASYSAATATPSAPQWSLSKAR